MTTMSPVSSPLRHDDLRLVEAHHIDVAERDRLARRIDDPDRGLLIDLRQAPSPESR